MVDVDIHQAAPTVRSALLAVQCERLVVSAGKLPDFLCRTHTNPMGDCLSLIIPLGLRWPWPRHSDIRRSYELHTCLEWRTRADVWARELSLARKALLWGEPCASVTAIDVALLALGAW